MQLKIWLNAEAGRSAALAKRLGVSRSMVSQMIRDENPIRVPPAHYRAIQDFTAGDVSFEDLVPHLTPSEPEVGTRSPG